MKQMKVGIALAGMAALVMALAAGWGATGSLQRLQVVVGMEPAASSAAPPAAAALPADARVSFGTWSHVGPNNIAGAAQDIAVDPVTGYLYTVSPEGWVFRSADGAGTWVAVKRFDSDLPLSKLAIQRDSSGIVAYLGITSSSQLLRMTPDGQTTDLVLEATQIRTVGTDIYAVNVQGIWFSSDNGGYWEQRLAGEAAHIQPYCVDIEIAGNNVYAMCQTYDSFELKMSRDVYRSSNGGQFVKVWSPPADLANSGWMGAAQLAASRSNPNIVYVSIGRGSDRGAYVFRTTDGGTSWEQRTDPVGPNPFNASLLTDFEESCSDDYYQPSSHGYVFEVDPTDPDVVWIGSLELYRSNDGGLNFGRASLDDSKGSSVYHLPRDIRALRFSMAFNGGSNRSMYLATTRGVYSSADARAAVQTWPQTTCSTAGSPPSMSWTKRIKGYSTVDFAAIDLTPSGEVIATIGSGEVDPAIEDYGSYQHSPFGLYYGDLADPDSWSRLSHLRPKRVAIDPVVGMDRFYTSRCIGATLCRWDWSVSLQRWNVTAKKVEENVEHPMDYVFFTRDPSNRSRFWGSADSTINRSDNAMAAWTYTGQASNPQYLAAGAVSPANPNIVLLADSAGLIYRRADALSANSSTLWNATFSGPPQYWSATQVVFDPMRPERVYATATGEPSVLASRDSGQTWQYADRIGDGDGLPDRVVHSLTTDPDNGDVLYVGTDKGLHVTWNYAATGAPAWFEVPTPFAGAAIRKLVLLKGNDGVSMLYAFTAGRGIWTAPVKVQRFDDVPFNHWAYAYIEKLFKAGITGGCASDPLRFCPGQNVLRDQMAVFLLRAKHGKAYQPPAASGDFSDVATNYWAAAWIERLRDEGITGGCGVDPLRYCPTTPVRREEIAVFLLRAKHGANYQPPTATGVYADVPTSHWAAAWIEQLSREGIGGGCSTTPKNYCPTNPVTRDQMAVFMARAFGL